MKLHARGSEEQHGLDWSRGYAANLVINSCRRLVNCEGKKPGKYFWRKLKMRTCPTGVSGAIRMMANGMNVRRSLAVRRSACT